MEGFIKSILLWYKYGPIIFLIALPSVSIYGALSSWDVAERELIKYPHTYKMLIGISNNSTIYQDEHYFNKTRKYILFKNGLSSINTIDITEDSKTGISSSIQEGGLLKVILIYVFILLWGWLAWFYKQNKNA